MIGTAQEPMAFYNGYSDLAWLDLGGIVERAERYLKGWEFDTFVGTGSSGMLVLPMLAWAMNKHYLIVRKDEDLESSHSNSRFIGRFDERWIFVDDFIDSGRSFKRVQKHISELRSYVPELFDWEPKSSTLVGAYLYTTAEWGGAQGVIPRDDMSPNWLYQ